MTDSIPRIISVDDHVVEPPDLWTSRLPRQFIENGPRVVREKFDGGGSNLATAYGGWADVWYYDDVRAPMMVLMAAVGFDDSRRDFGVTTYDEIRPGGWKQTERLADMDDNHVDASLCFPNIDPALLRPDLRRAQGQGARARVREGLQRLDGRRVVRPATATAA